MGIEDLRSQSAGLSQGLRTNPDLKAVAPGQCSSLMATGWTVSCHQDTDVPAQRSPCTEHPPGPLQVQGLLGEPHTHGDQPKERRKPNSNYSIPTAPSQKSDMETEV